MDLPFKAEYAKSGRASCRACKSPIAQASLRLAVMVQSRQFDGQQPNWFHHKCFFLKQRPKTVDDIQGYETLRLEDQKAVKKNVEACSGAAVPSAKGKKRGNAAAAGGAHKDFKIEYSKSNRAACRGCEQKIMTGEIRISKKDFETDVGKRYGGQDMWHHLSCFAKLRSELAYFDAADNLPGFKGLSKEDQQEASTQLPAIKQEAVPAKKVKVDPEAAKEDKAFQAQNKLYYKNRDALAQLSKREFDTIFECNELKLPQGKDGILDRLADVFTFGVPELCPVCEDGEVVYSREGYCCQGHVSGWTPCTNIIKEPKRFPLQIPSELKEKHAFLNKYKFVECARIIKDFNPTVGVKKEEEDDEVDAPPKVQRDRPALYDMEFVLLGNVKDKKEQLKTAILKLGGRVTTKISNQVMAAIGTKETVAKAGARVREMEEVGVHVVSEDFLEEAPKNVNNIPDLVVRKSICTWGNDPNQRLPAAPSPSLKSKSKSHSMFASKMPGKVKLKLVNGVAVDPESGLEDVAHVYTSGSDKYTVTLGLMDVIKKKNSFYKLQLLEGNQKNKYWIFRAWGRIGTTIGNNKVEMFSTFHDALQQFEFLYEEKSGNRWEDREHFVKVPGRMYPIDVDYGDGDDDSLDIVEKESNLKAPVQDLIKLIFNQKLMKSVMKEFELDMEKMPLGKLSKAQIQSAYAVLTEVQQLLDAGETVEARYVDTTNRFYTFIPHSFGIDNPPLIRDKDTVQKKLEMLNSLLELEVAYSLMKGSGEHTVDTYYSQLKTDIDVLEKDSEEFKIICEYVKNTHAQTHDSYDLVVEEVFAVKRHGEEKRFKPFKKLHNRRLLWHGSRVTNFAGILSQGLRIAPPEAPVTGYMFGKGIYFADMVSKSANYCCTSSAAPSGLMLLCDVALGNMYERTRAEYVEKLPKGMHSCKGMGRTEPDPKVIKKIDDVEVPLGKGKIMSDRKSDLLYNEFIVYDVAQVNVKYLLKMNFKYKY